MRNIDNGSTGSVTAGSTESGDVVFSGGTLEVLLGGVADRTVLSGGTLDVFSGGIASGTILSGGTENVAGTEQAAGVSSGGFLNVLSGGIAHDLLVSNGGTLNVSGTVTSNTFIYAGGVENILSGGLATGDSHLGTRISGGTVSVFSGGEIDHATVFDGGELDVAGTVLSNIAISAGGIENVLSGGQVQGTSASGTAVSAGGTLNILADGTAEHITVYDSGTLNVAGTILSNVIVDAGGTEIILSGGQVTGSSGAGTGVSGIVSVTSAGKFDHFSIYAGGTVSVFSGGDAHNISISAGTLNIAGSAESFTLYGGEATVSAGGIIHDFTVSSGATLDLFGESASNSLVASGGTENVSSGGLVTGGFDSSGIANNGVSGTVNVYSAGTVDYTGVLIGGKLEVLAGGTANEDVVFGGEEDVYGSATSTLLLSATDTTSGSPTSGQSFAGFLDVFAGGVAGATTVSAGGDLVVSSGGIASNTTVLSGGTLDVEQDGKLAGGGFTLTETTAGDTAFAGPLVVSGTTGKLDFGGTLTQLENFTISGLENADIIDLTSVDFVAGGSANLLGGNELEVKIGGSTYDFELDKTQNFTGEFFHLSNDGQGDTDITENTAPCYCPGTLITADRGEIAVEKLSIGDKVVTLSGAIRPIKWIGRRSYAGRFAVGQKHILPVCIQAGALGDKVPRRDLWISPQHAMYLQGVLIEAKDLVNDRSIVQATKVDSVTYIHIELETHDVIIAEGAFSETFVDDDSRAMFHNAHEYRQIYADEPRRTARYCAPRLRDGYRVEAVRRHIDALAGLRHHTPQAHSLRGFVDVVAPKLISGWAQNPEHPAVPVCLEIVADGRLIGEVLANRYRQDLELAGLGNGRHGFEFALPSGKAFRHVEVRRALDGTALPSTATLPLSAKVARNCKLG